MTKHVESFTQTCPDCEGRDSAWGCRTCNGTGIVHSERTITTPDVCSWCAKNETEGVTIVNGPGVSICDECIALCATILAERSK
jgi:DnaJ-class molecular chaperone